MRPLLSLSTLSFYLFVHGQPVRLGLRAGAVHQDPGVRGQAGKGEGDAVVDLDDLARRPRVLQLGRRLFLGACGEWAE